MGVVDGEALCACFHESFIIPYCLCFCPECAFINHCFYTEACRNTMYHLYIIL